MICGFCYTGVQVLAALKGGGIIVADSSVLLLIGHGFDPMPPPRSLSTL